MRCTATGVRAAGQLVALLCAMALAAALAAPVHAAEDAWPYVIHRVTEDTLTQEGICPAGGRLFWKQAQETYHPDGTVTSTPYEGWWLDLATGRRSAFDTPAEGLMWLAAGGDWVITQHGEATATVHAYNARSGERLQVALPEGAAAPPVTDGERVAWTGFGGAVWSMPLTGGPAERLATGTTLAPAIDAGRVCWARSGWMGPAGTGEADTGPEPGWDAAALYAADASGGTTATVAIAGFSPAGVDISGGTVIAWGESPDYRTHLYVWDIATGEVRRAYSSYPDYIGNAFISGQRAVIGCSVTSGKRQVRVLDLPSGAVANVTPADLWALPWGFDGSTVGMSVKWTWTTLEAAWCDLDERPSTADTDATDGGGGSSPTPRSVRIADAAEPSQESSETTTPVSPASAEPTTPAEVPSSADTSGTPEKAPVEDADDTRPLLPWVLGGIAALGILGAGAMALRRRAGG